MLQQALNLCMSLKIFNRYLFISSLFTLAIFSFSACVNEVETPNVCFQENVLPIFVNKCAVTGCHNASSRVEGYDFSNYDGIMKGIKPGKTFGSEAYRAIAIGSMPPKSHTQLSKLEVSTIKNWIRMNAPNSSNCNTCDSSFSFKNRIQPLMDKWCVGCHTGVTAGGGYDLTNYSNVKNANINNRLIGSMQHQAGFSPMPKGASKLSECDIKAVEKWIAAGYPDN